MDARAVVLEELKRRRNSDRLANALSLLTSFECDKIRDSGAAANPLKSNVTLMSLE
jgi:hypothetical protein